MADTKRTTDEPLLRARLTDKDTPGTPAQQAFDEALKGIHINRDDMTIRNEKDEIVGLVD